MTDDQIAAAYLEHGNFRRTSTATGISELRVIAVARARGLKPQRRSRYRTPAEIRAGIIAMHAQGLPPSKIAQRMSQPTAFVLDQMDRLRLARGNELRAANLDVVRRCSRTGCGVCVGDDESICADCLPRFDSRPVQRAGARLDHDALGRGE